MTTLIPPTSLGDLERAERELEASYWNTISDEARWKIAYEAENGLHALEEKISEPELTAEEHEFIVNFNVACGPYASLCLLPGASKSQRRRKRAAYHHNGMARNRLHSAQNGYGGNVPAHLQEERLRDWNIEEIQGKSPGELRAYMGLWMRPLITSSNMSAVRDIVEVYQNAIEAEAQLSKASLAGLDADLDSAAQRRDALEQFVLALSKRQRDAEQDLRASVPPASVPPTAPLAPPSA